MGYQKNQDFNQNHRQIINQQQQKLEVVLEVHLLARKEIPHIVQILIKSDSNGIKINSSTIENSWKDYSPIIMISKKKSFMNFVTDIALFYLAMISTRWTHIKLLWNLGPN